MRALWVVGFSLLFWTISLIFVWVLPRWRLRRAARRIAKQVKVEAGSSGFRLVQGKLRAVGPSIDAGDEGQSPIVRSGWAAAGFAFEKGIPDEEAASTGLGVETSEGTVHLAPPVRLLMGSTWNWKRKTKWSALSSSTSLRDGDEVIAAVNPKAEDNQPYRASIDKAPDLRRPSLLAATASPAVAENPLRRLLHPVAVFAALLGIVPGWTYGRSYDQTEEACEIRCREDGDCHLAAWFGGNKLARSRKVIDLVEGEGLFACVPHSDQECQRSSECRLLGWCHDKDGDCVVSTNDDCRYTPGCIYGSRCTAVLPGDEPGNTAGGCELLRDEDCPTKACLYRGACKVGPARYGLQCLALTDADCENSYVCHEYGRCFARGGDCLGPPPDPGHCAKSEGCRTGGTCTESSATKGCIVASDEECQSSSACALYQHCKFSRGKGCVADTEGLGCARSQACSIYGNCKPDSDACKPGSDADCAHSLRCKEHGECRKVGDVCVKDCASSPRCAELGLCRETPQGCVASADGCKASKGCADLGWCSAADGRCQALSEVDCKDTPGCKEYGRCSAVEGQCVVRKDSDCRSSLECAIHGNCTVKGAACAPGSDKDCQDAQTCPANNNCTVGFEGACVSAGGDQCIFTDQCKLLGLCVFSPSQSQCVAVSDAECSKSEACQKRGWCFVTKDGGCFVK